MNISEYLLMVVGAASAGIIADVVNSSLSRRVKGLEKYIKFGVTLCVASCMVLPLLNITKSDGWLLFETVPYGEYIYNDTMYNENYILERECEDKLFDEILIQTGINPISISIQIETEENKPVIKKAEVVLRKEDMQNLEIIQEAVVAALGTEAEVIAEK